jgi:nucleotide-binding universal stress UspA family protein
MALGCVIVAVDGSEAALHAAREGLAVLQPADEVLIVTVVEGADETLVTGAGFAGGVMSTEELQRLDDARVVEGRGHVEAAASALGLTGAELLVARGGPGSILCDLAIERSARAIVLGSRGHGGIKRALLGSVSDWVVRNAPCPVVVTGPQDDADES